MGDLHVGDSECDDAMMRDAIKWLQAEPNRFALLAGDLLNMATKQGVSDVYGQTMSPKDQRRYMQQMLAPVADKIIAVIRGNHDQRAEKEIGDDPIECLCAAVGVPYFEDEAYLTLQVGHWRHKSKDKRSPVQYIGLMSHGHGGGRLSGGKLNSAMSARQILTADFYLSGHSHDPIIKPDVCWETDSQGVSIIERQQMFIVCGASLKRKPGTGYASRFGYRPLATIWPILTLDGTCKRMTARTGD
jgi:predicted phosphodiesterase